VDPSWVVRTGLWTGSFLISDISVNPNAVVWTCRLQVGSFTGRHSRQQASPTSHWPLGFQRRLTDQRGRTLFNFPTPFAGPGAISRTRNGAIYIRLEDAIVSSAIVQRTLRSWKISRFPLHPCRIQEASVGSVRSNEVSEGVRIPTKSPAYTDPNSPVIPR
jgi:hypothetical protein